MIFILEEKKGFVIKLFLDIIKYCNIFSFLYSFDTDNTLANKFSFIFDTDSPDYLIYNVFGSSNLDQKYNNCVKIAYFTENRIPDLNEVDYALGFSHINYLDRFFKHILFDDKSTYIIIRKKYILNRLKKKNFVQQL